MAGKDEITQGRSKRSGWATKETHFMNKNAPSGEAYESRIIKIAKFVRLKSMVVKVL